MESACQCPDYWFELLGEGGAAPCYFEDCPVYSSCGGQTWEPPCGGCDYCIFAQISYYDDGWFRKVCEDMHAWTQLQAACA